MNWDDFYKNHYPDLFRMAWLKRSREGAPDRHPIDTRVILPDRALALFPSALHEKAVPRILHGRKKSLLGRTKYVDGRTTDSNYTKQRRREGS